MFYIGLMFIRNHAKCGAPDSRQAYPGVEAHPHRMEAATVNNEARVQEVEVRRIELRIDR